MAIFHLNLKMKNYNKETKQAHTQHKSAKYVKVMNDACTIIQNKRYDTILTYKAKKENLNPNFGFVLKICFFSLTPKLNHLKAAKSLLI